MMMMRRALFAAMLAVGGFAPPGLVNAAPPAAATVDPQRPLWLRQPAISPDGSRIAFVYGGQLWMVPTAGGEAVPLVADAYYTSHPVWSPDGSRLAFASQRNGNTDVFVMPLAGGPVVRLTQHSAPDVPESFSPDGKTLYFSSPRLGSPKADALDAVRGLGPLLPQLYAVPVSGGRAERVIDTPALQVQPSADGTRLLYTDQRSIENEWRKHHQSDATRDIWLADLRSGTHRRLTDHRGEDRNAVWSPQGDAMLWLSERSGSFNVWRQPLQGGQPQQVTFHQHHPVRFLSSARDGTLAYSYDGELWRLPAGSTQPQRVAVTLRPVAPAGGEVNVRLNEQATELAVSPNAPEVAFVARGDVFVASLLSGAVRRITATPAQERSVSFSPDGRRLLYASERGGTWDVFEARLRRADDVMFSGVAPFDEVRVIGGDSDNFQPVYSPDGKRIAYRADRNTLRVHDLGTKTSVEVLPRDAVYSYTDGDLNFAWSPDGRWLATRTGFSTGNAEIELVDAAGRSPRRNISQSGFMDMLPQVSADGNVVLWLSDRQGLRSADGEPQTLDVMAAFLTPEAFEAFQSSPEEQLRKQVLAAAQAQQPPVSAAGQATRKGAPPLPEVDGLQRRTVRLTPFSTVPLFYRLTPDGRTLVLVAADPSGQWVGYAIDQPSRRMRVLFQSAPLPQALFATDAAVTALYALTPGGVQRIDLASGQASMVPFEAEAPRDGRAEVQAIFEHVWRLTQSKFYDRKMHGVDWPAVGAAYRRFVPHVRHWEELAELLSEMVGELNASHQGAHYSPRNVGGDDTASLGLYYDDSWRGTGRRVAQVLAGGPADKAASALKPGAIVLAIDGRPIGPDDDVDALLNRKAGRAVLVTVRPANGANTVDEAVTPVHWLQESALAYARWVERRRALVAQRSQGRIGYVHVPHMNLQSYLRTYADLFGRYRDAEAVVVDVRFNGGGNLHDALIAMLTGTHKASLITRDGVDMGRVPGSRWAKPSVVVANAGSYSDGSVFPALYQRERIGPVVGEAVPGTGTAVLWEPQIEPRLTYGVPQLGFQGIDGRWFENQETVPDVPASNDPNSVAEGKDLPLEAAVARLLQTLGPLKTAR